MRGGAGSLLAYVAAAAVCIGLVGVIAFVASRTCGATGGGASAARGASPEGEAAEAPPYPAGLSAQSSPEDVVAALIRALDEEDEPTLQGLVAVQAEMAAVGGIYERGGRQSPHGPASVAKLTAAGWALTYAFLEAGQSAVDGVELEGDRATVFVAARRADGSDARLRAKLVREEGLWKVLAGLESAGR